MTDGRYLFTYEADDLPAGRTSLWVAEVVDPFTAWPEERTRLDDGTHARQFDATPCRTDGDVFVACWTDDWARVMYSTRTGDSTWSPPAIMLSERPDLIHEAALRRTQNASWLTYSRNAAGSRLDDPGQVLVRKMTGTAPGPSVEIPGALTGGKGTTNRAARALLASTGRRNKLITTWNAWNNGLERPIQVSMSEDGGTTWSAPVQVSTAGIDCWDPYPLLVGNQLRIYFAQSTPQTGARQLAVVSSDDRGVTWTPVAQVPVETQVGGSHAAIWDNGDGAAALLPYQDQTSLVVARV